MAYLFPDNTVLCSFAAVERLGLLREVLDGRGRWCGAVRSEAQKSAVHLPELGSVDGDGWLGDPVLVDDPEEVRRVNVMRVQLLGGDPRKPTQHLGEAETCFLIAEREEFKDSRWISDDRESLEHARFRRIPVSETPDLVRDAIDLNLVSRDGGIALMQQMASCGRSLRIPADLQV